MSKLPKVHKDGKYEYFNGEDLVSVIIPDNIHLRFEVDPMTM